MISTPFTLQQMLQEMDIALADEIIKQQNGNRRRRHKVNNGILISDSNGHCIYDFTLEDPWDVADDTPTRIIFDVRQEIKGFVIHATGSTIRITTDQPLPPAALQKAYVVDDPTKLLEDLRFALKSNDEGNAQLGSKSFGLKSYSSGSQVVQGGWGTKFIPDISQQKAIYMALGSEVTYIVGPPGTGKTSTLAAIAFSQLCAGRTILIAAHTNIAIDNAIIRLAEMCDKSESNVANQFLKAGNIIRFGTPQLAARLEKEFPDIHLASIVKRHSGELAKRKEQLNFAKQTLNQQIANHEQELISMRQSQQLEQQQLMQQRTTSASQLRLLQEREQAYQVSLNRKQGEYVRQRDKTQQQLQILIQQQTQFTEQQSKWKNDWSQYTAEMSKLEQRLVEAQKTNTLLRVFKGIPSPRTLAQEHANYQQKRWFCEQSLAKLQGQMAGLYQQRATSEFQLVQCTSVLKSLEAQRSTPAAEAQQMQQVRATLAQIEQALSQINSPVQQLEHQLPALRKQVEDIQQQIAALDVELGSIEKQIVTEARVIATTLTKTYMNQLISPRRFDVVIMDEVSMASLPAVYIAASHADQSAVIIGDPQQLSPIKEAETDSAEYWLGKSLFEMRGIDLQAALQSKGNSVILQEQSRMHPVIAGIASQYVYKGLLRNSKRVEGGQQEKFLKDVQPLPGAPLLLCDTSAAAPCSIRPEGGSRINAYHALCTIELARHVLATLPNRDLQEGDFRIGLITPYTKQSRLLQKLVKDAGLENAIRVGTVHRFQGLEAEVIIFDTVESPTLSINFTCGSFGSKAMKIINVAITRAKHKLIVVANYQYILRNLDEQNTLRQVIEVAHASNTISSTNILQLPSPVRLPHQIGGENYRCEYFDQGRFYEKFRQDVYDAQKELVIYSPFIGAKRTQMLIPLLEERCKAGLTITVVTSSTNKLDQEAEHQLRNIGVKMHKKKDMHEKMVFIDDTILYIGSLNVLSHIHTTEVMSRALAPESIRELKQDYQVDALERKPIRKGTRIEVAFDELPKTASMCKECGQPLVLRQRRKDQKPFYVCSVREANHTLEEAPLHLPRLAKLLCGGCGGATTIHAGFDSAWIDCGTATPCGYRQDIVYKD